MSVLTEWLRALVGSAVFCALALALCPEGRPKRVLRAACGVVMAAALLSPVVELDMQALPEAIARYGEAARAVADGAEEEADRLNRTIIERECAAYILDKADALGLSASEVSVTARWSEEGFWYPWECRVSCAEGGRAALSRAIEAELGIPPERQSWEEST